MGRTEPYLVARGLRLKGLRVTRCVIIAPKPATTGDTDISNCIVRTYSWPKSCVGNGSSAGEGSSMAEARALEPFGQTREPLSPLRYRLTRALAGEGEGFPLALKAPGKGSGKPIAETLARVAGKGSG